MDDHAGVRHQPGRARHLLGGEPAVVRRDVAAELVTRQVEQARVLVQRPVRGEQAPPVGTGRTFLVVGKPLEHVGQTGRVFLAACRVFRKIIDLLLRRHPELRMPPQLFMQPGGSGFLGAGADKAWSLHVHSSKSSRGHGRQANFLIVPRQRSGIVSAQRRETRSYVGRSLSNSSRAGTSKSIFSLAFS